MYLTKILTFQNLEISQNVLIRITEAGFYGLNGTERHRNPQGKSLTGLQSFFIHHLTTTTLCTGSQCRTRIRISKAKIKMINVQDSAD